MIIPKCCIEILNVKNSFNTTVSLYYKDLSVKQDDGKQINKYTQTLVATKRCLMRDRTNASIEIGAFNQVRDPANLKELIFSYFPIRDIEIDSIKWEGSDYLITGSEQIKSFTANRKRYTAPDGLPFIRIYIGLKKL